MKSDKEVEQSIIYHTSQGDIEVPAPPITIEVPVRSSAAIAPEWLVFSDDIINVKNIIRIQRRDTEIVFSTSHSAFSVPITNIDKTWPILQKVFAEGISR